MGERIKLKNYICNKKSNIFVSNYNVQYQNNEQCLFVWYPN